MDKTLRCQRRTRRTNFTSNQLRWVTRRHDNTGDSWVTLLVRGPRTWGKLRGNRTNHVRAKYALSTPTHPNHQVDPTHPPGANRPPGANPTLGVTDGVTTANLPLASRQSRRRRLTVRRSYRFSLVASLTVRFPMYSSKPHASVRAL